jgi:hypothetical protein
MISSRFSYARLLRLRRVHLRPWAAMLLFEGTLLSAILLVLAEVVGWYAVLALPVTVAAMVKLYDLVAIVLANRAASRRARQDGSPGIWSRPTRVRGSAQPVIRGVAAAPSRIAASAGAVAGQQAPTSLDDLVT